MGQRGYAVAFFLVLLAACAGAFLGGRLLFARITGGGAAPTAWAPPETPAAEVALATDAPVDSSPAPAAPTNVPTRSSTRLILTPFVPPSPTFEPTNTPEPDTPTPDVTATPSATPTLVSRFPYVLASPVRNTNGDCSGNLILGQVTDRAGNPLADVRLHITDEFGSVDDTKASKSGNEAGRYDFPLFGPGRTYALQVVDSTGQPLSERVNVEHGIGINAKASCHWVDWKRQ